MNNKPITILDWSLPNGQHIEIEYWPRPVENETNKRISVSVEVDGFGRYWLMDVETAEMLVSGLTQAIEAARKRDMDDEDNRTYYCQDCGGALVEGDEIDYDATRQPHAREVFRCPNCGVGYSATYNGDTGMWYPGYA